MFVDPGKSHIPKKRISNVQALAMTGGGGRGVHAEWRMPREDCYFHEVDYRLVPGKRAGTLYQRL